VCLSVSCPRASPWMSQRTEGGKEVHRTEDKRHSEREKRKLDERFPEGREIQLQLQRRMVRPGSADSGRAREA
jgi:hypothetical protein